MNILIDDRDVLFKKYKPSQAEIELARLAISIVIDKLEPCALVSAIRILIGECGMRFHEAYASCKMAI